MRRKLPTQNSQTSDDAVSDPLKDVCAIARQFAGRKEPPSSPEERLRRIHDRWGETLNALDDDKVKP